MSKDRQIQQDVKQAFDNQALDDGTREALRAAREQALEQAPAAKKPAWLPAAAVAGLVAVVATVLGYRGQDSTVMPQMTADELAVITSEDELELFEELEFYLWLEGEEKT